MSAPLRCAIAGLGNVGWRFDEDPGRKAIWSHAGAYASLAGDYEIVGACDPSQKARRDFSARYPSVPTFENVTDLMQAQTPEIVSICVPNALHWRILKDVLAQRPPRVVWCEKPLATSLRDGTAMVEACARKSVFLIVSHVRRWSPQWQYFKEVMAEELGPLRSLRIAMPNRLWSIGSHAVDLLSWLGGPVNTIAALPVSALAQDNEPAVGGVFGFASGAMGILQVTGKKSKLIVEAEAIGDRGRLTYREDRQVINLERFTASPRYAGYETLGDAEPLKMRVDENFSPFVSVALEAAELARRRRHAPTCDGTAALEVQRLLHSLARTAEEPATA